MAYAKVEIREIEAKTILTPQTVGSLSGAFDYSLNPYAGCAFACSYCYVPKFPNGRHAASEWGRWLEVKTNAPALIRKERGKVFNSRIFFSSATDPYQYAELTYRLSRRCLTELAHYQPARLTMHTRSHLILQDLDLLSSYGDRLAVGVSFTTDSEEIRKKFEPQAPSLKRRLELIERLAQAGIRVYASIAPLLPCRAEKLVEMLRPYVDSAWVDAMRWKEVNSRADLLEEYSWFFNGPEFYRAREHIRSHLGDMSGG